MHEGHWAAVPAREDVLSNLVLVTNLNTLRWVWFLAKERAVHLVSLGKGSRRTHPVLSSCLEMLKTVILWTDGLALIVNKYMTPLGVFVCVWCPFPESEVYPLGKASI